MRIVIFTLLIALTAAAQPPAAPSPDAAGDRNGENIGNYNIVNSFETGYRFSAVGGNFFQYRSSVNFGNGIRLLGSSLVVNSRNGHGGFFDQAVLTTQGLGNDPYESAALRLEKNRIYRYDMTWRQNDYFNPGLVTDGASGEHLMDTQYRMQDHNVTLFPQSNLKFFAGFSATSQTGPAYSSIESFNNTGDIFPLFSDVRRVWREYRLGNEFRVLGIRVNWMHGWEDFKDDAKNTLAAGVPGEIPLVPVNGVKLNSFQGIDPNHGTSPYWRAAIFTDQKMFNANGRFTYTAGRRAFVDDQGAIGSINSVPRGLNIINSGNAERPVATGNLNLNFTPNSKLTVSNGTSVYSMRTLGNSLFTQADTTNQGFTVLFYNYLGIRTIANDTNLNYQASPLVGFTAGYHYSDRLIRSSEQTIIQSRISNTPAEQTNVLNSGDVGVRIRPWKPLTAILSAEVGTNSQPFTPRVERDFHVLNGRLNYRLKTLQFSAAANANYNVNSISLTSYSAQSRTYSVSGNWTPSEKFTVDAGYSRIHTYTIGGIAYFLNQQLTSGQSSIYLSNLNSTYVGMRYAYRRRADFYVSYTRVQDTGDGRSNPFGNGIGSPLPLFQGVQTFPLAFQSPMARVSVKINDRLRWNAGYQYYGYRQDFTTVQNYRAHTGYTSLSVSF